jgi:hypothetical protein
MFHEKIWYQTNNGCNYNLNVENILIEVVKSRLNVFFCSNVVYNIVQKKLFLFISSLSIYLTFAISATKDVKSMLTFLIVLEFLLEIMIFSEVNKLIIYHHACPLL